MKIIIVGGSATGLTLANLLGDEHDITIIERDEEIAKKIVNEISALVIQGDGTEMAVLNEAGLSETDAIITTIDDKTNLMICEIAKSEKIKKLFRWFVIRKTRSFLLNWGLLILFLWLERMLQISKGSFLG